MRKTLLATSALALAGAMAVGSASAADKMSVGVSGYMQQWIGMSSVDAVDKDGKATAVEGGVAQQSDSEFYVKGSLKADNGMTFGVVIEVEGNSSGSMIDESYVSVSGDFGQVKMGAEDPVSALTHQAVTDVGFGINCGDMGKWINGIDGCGPGGMGTSGWGLGDKNQVSYFTPRMNGVQAAATYIPNIGQEGGAAALENNDADAWAVGMNYMGEVGDVSVAFSLGHYQASGNMDAAKMLSGSEAVGLSPLTAYELKGHEETIARYNAETGLAKYKKEKTVGTGTTQAAAAAATNAIADARDMTMSKADSKTVSNFGLKIGLGSFGFDVAYLALDSGAYKVARMDVVKYGEAPAAWDHDGNAATDKQSVNDTADGRNNPDNDIAREVLVKDTSKDAETVAFGVNYTDGPMAVSLSHMIVEADDGAQQSGTMLSGSYTLAPGVAWRSSLFAAEKDSADGSSVEGAGFMTGITIGF